MASKIRLILLYCKDLQDWCNSSAPVWSVNGIEYDGEQLDAVLRPVIEKKIENLTREPGMEMWYSYYGIIHEGKIVGLIGPKGRHDPPDQVEIGYGIGEKYRNLGLATESVRAICWLYAGEDLRLITARTDHSNIASQRVLSKAGFQQVSQDQNEVYWQFDLKSLRQGR